MAAQSHRLGMEEWECSNGLAESTDCPDPYERKQNQMQKLYHSISLLSIPGKVHASILKTRMRTITEGKVLEQGAFRAV